MSAQVRLDAKEDATVLQQSMGAACCVTPQQNHRIEQQVSAALFAAEPPSTDMFQCMRCHARRCTYMQRQSRSADEPVSTSIAWWSLLTAHTKGR